MNTKTRAVALLLAVLLGLSVMPAMATVECENENVKVLATTPTAAFELHEDGTATHTPTGLTWMRCSLGQEWDGNTQSCVGTPTTFSWTNALLAVATFNGDGFAGHQDWRLPNKNELESIVERRCWKPAINAAVFPDTPAHMYWSSTPFMSSSAIRVAWVVDFGNFVSGGVGRFEDYNNRVRLVRGGQ